MRHKKFGKDSLILDGNIPKKKSKEVIYEAWFHAAVAKSGNKMTLYIEGVKVREMKKGKRIWR